MMEVLEISNSENEAVVRCKPTPNELQIDRMVGGSEGKKSRMCVKVFNSVRKVVSPIDSAIWVTLSDQPPTPILATSQSDDTKITPDVSRFLRQVMEVRM